MKLINEVLAIFAGTVSFILVILSPDDLKLPIATFFIITEIVRARFNLSDEVS